MNQDRHKLKKRYDQTYADRRDVFGEPLPLARKAASLVGNAGEALDIGAGEGRNALAMAEAGLEVLATDISEVGLRRLKEAAEERGITKVQTEVRDAIDLPGREYDVVFCSFLLHHLKEAEGKAFVPRIKELLRPGGVVGILAFTKESDLYRSDPHDQFYIDPGYLKQVFSDWEIISFADVEGGSLRKKSDGTPMKNLIERILARKP